MVLEKRTYHPFFVCSAQVNVETAFLCNGAALVSQSFTFLICHSEGFADRAPFVVDVTTCANFNVERGLRSNRSFWLSFRVSDISLVS